MSIKHHLVQGNGNIDSAHQKNANGHNCHVLSLTFGYLPKSLGQFWVTLSTAESERIGSCSEEFLVLVRSCVSRCPSGCPVRELRLHRHRNECQCVVEEEGWRLTAEVLFQILVCRLTSTCNLKPPELNLLVFSPVRKTLFC